MSPLCLKYLTAIEQIKWLVGTLSAEDMEQNPEVMEDLRIINIRIDLLDGMVRNPKLPWRDKRTAELLNFFDGPPVNGS